MYKNKKRYFWLLLAVLTAFPALYVHADGSKDLYPSGKEGLRAFLRSDASAVEYWPFPNLGTHYVYAKAGETITLASSLQATGGSAAARIKLYSPTGTAIPLNFSNGGNILNRAQELAGPQIKGQSVTNRYTPAYYLVPDGGTGIYRVEFLSTSSSSPSSTINANSNWTQTSTSSSVTIAAWDISVINDQNTNFIPGRVYTNVLNLSNGSSSVNSNGFYGIVYPLTKDGYTYRVNNNGNNGIYFTFFVNNNGFVDPNTQLPIYKSLNSVGVNDDSFAKKVHNPNNADKGTHITHKIFYTLPATDLPQTAPIAVTNDGGQTWSPGTTWLKNAPKIPVVETPKLIGLDGIEGQVGKKGGHIVFNADTQGNYLIEISSGNTPEDFPKRIMTGQSTAGSNRVLWDGTDGDGNPLKEGKFPVKVTVQLQGAEVHFPFLDMEYNRNGTIIELLNHDSLPTQVVVSDIVYWNDSDIPNSSNGSNSNPKNNSHLPPTNSIGIKSSVNGHIWGVDGSSFTNHFGDAKSIDTWTFIAGEKKTTESSITVKEADLEVILTADKSNIKINDEIEYTSIVKNNGPSNVEGATYIFALPPGFEPVGTPVFTGSANCIESTSIEYDAATNSYRSLLNLENGCEVSYTFKAKVSDASNPDDTEAISSILRPRDVTDINATNRSDASKPMYELPVGMTWDELWKYPAQWPTDSDVDNYYIPPFSAEYECQYNISNLECNNVARVSPDLQRVSDLIIEKTASVTTPEVGTTITFSLKIKNDGPHAAKNVIVTDNVPSGFNIGVINNGGKAAGKIITWNIPVLAKEDSTIVSFQATVLSSGSFVNTATVDGDVEDPNPNNNSDTAIASPRKNYWIGGNVDAPNNWDKVENWTAGFVPAPEEDIEFATESNNPTVSGDPMSGPAKDDLYLGDGNSAVERVIGNIINDSDKDLWITTGDQLIVKGEVKDNNANEGTIIVKASPDKPSGTLLFEDPTKNTNVGGIVEFYNQAYDCKDCGYYTRSWQYFGIPVKESGFPYNDVAGNETVNQWLEPFNGNKWQPAPYTPDTELKGFKGYQITSSETTKPTDVYSFEGTLHVGDAVVNITKTANVNYTGANLVSNSFTAAIPISSDALSFPTGVQQTVYLFNTGTRDEWRKLNGTMINVDGYQSGQYLAVPVNLGGTAHFPDRIPSMHSFMVLAESGSGGNLTINYSKLVKNMPVALGDGATEIVTRSATAATKDNNNMHSATSIPSLVIDVIGEKAADRLWIFQNNETTLGFDNGWDGRKMSENDIPQLYVIGTDKSQLQVATVPGINNITVGFEANSEGKYTFEFSLSNEMNNVEIFLYDEITGAKQRISNTTSYSFDAKKGEPSARFRLISSGIDSALSDDESQVEVTATTNGKIRVKNNSENSCTAFISNDKGTLIQRVEVGSNREAMIDVTTAGIYVVRLQNSELNDARRIIVK